MLDPREVGVRAADARCARRLQLLLAEKPEDLAIAVFGTAAQRRRAAELAIYAAWVNGARLPERKKKPDAAALRTIRLFGHARGRRTCAGSGRIAEGNLLCRELTVLPPNELTPGAYRKRVRAARAANRLAPRGIRHEAPAQAWARARSSRWRRAAPTTMPRSCIFPTGTRERASTVALVGKGICFDTGGHNLKPARYMQGMHEDMNGSAVALGILLAATRDEAAGATSTAGWRSRRTT